MVPGPAYKLSVAPPIANMIDWPLPLHTHWPLIYALIEYGVVHWYMIASVHG